MTWASWAAPRVERLEAWLAPRFAPIWPLGFADACRYPVYGGGKRVRPLLTLAAYEAIAGGDCAPALPAAAAVELVHTYSLVHDDLPCMDDDDERRGRPTVHRAFDEATAVLVGDALLTEAFAAVTEVDAPDAVRVALVRELAQAAGSTGMVGGQAADVGLGASIADPAVLERLHRLKTGALIRWATRAGARVARADDDALAALTAYGEHVGLAFQLADDLLDAHEAASDDGPPSFVRLLGEPATRARALALADEAIAIADRLGSPVLAELARFIVTRDV